MILRIKYYIKKAFAISPYILIKKIVQKIENKLKFIAQKNKDFKSGTHINFNVPLIKNNYINIKELDVSGINKQAASYLSKMYLDHRFNLLGSGWVKNSYDSESLGVEGYKYSMNAVTKKSLSSYCINPEYEPIDWQKDYKSGYRWSEKTWYKDIRYGHLPGVDIKVPWELARMQHLPQLAVFALVDEGLKEKNIMEFKNQIIDFITNNPPRFGVNWSCTMDVGIRAANILVAYDMFLQIDSFGILDNDFKQIFAKSIYEHGLHIVNNLEYNELVTTNHYLSDIVGLLFVSAYFDCYNKINQWLAFSIQEIINEIQKQFYEDGGNFEGSISYHRLSGELLIYSIALIHGLKDDKIKALQNYNITNWKIKPKLLSFEKQQFSIDNEKSKIILSQFIIDKLYKIGRFTVDITKPSSEVPQIGDNDSGRFFIFSPIGEFLDNFEAERIYLNLKGYNECIREYSVTNELFWDENILNHSAFISAVSGLFSDKIFKTNIKFEKSFIKSLADNINLQSKDKSYKLVNVSKNFKIKRLHYYNDFLFEADTNFKNLNFISYPDFGIYIFKADNMHLTICAASLGQNGNGGHNHNDKLSFDLWLNGNDIVKDPGTYVYTPLPYRRNEFRSTNAHSVPIVDGLEQNSWLEGVIGLFNLANESSFGLIENGVNFIELFLKYKDVVFVRKFKITENKLIVRDGCNKKFGYKQFRKYSNGYGKLKNE